MVRMDDFFLATILLPLAASQTSFCTQGLLPCVQNAACNATTDQCDCTAGFYGNGRVFCAPTTRCACTALADPNFGLFDTKTNPPQQVKANLPCSVTAASQAFFGGCALNKILFHPEIRGTGSAANLRVFVNEIEVLMFFPSSLTFSVNAAGITVTSGTPSLLTSAVNADGFQTATVASCDNMQVGYNTTYAGAYLNLPATTFNSPGLCGNCDSQANENAGNTALSNFAYFLKFIATTAEQKGPYGSQCGTIQSLVSTQCSDAELALVATVCMPYVSPFGTCLIDDPASPTVTDFSTLLTDKFIPCLTNVCVTGTAAAQCVALTASQTPTCQLSPVPVGC